MPEVFKPELGLVCITTSDAVRYRTITRKQLLRFSTAEQQDRLTHLYQTNLAVLNAAIDFCVDHAIRLYRISSNIFPFADTPLGREVLETYRQELRLTGLRATTRPLRLVIHPDQFVVLNSESPTVIANSITILQMHADILDMLGQPRSPWAALEIHGGKGGRGDALVQTIQALPEAIRTRLILENDEYSYGPEQILAVCRAAGVPMVYDAHHHVIHDRLTNYSEPAIAAMVRAAQTTWPVAAWQMAHISNGQTAFADRAHHDLILDMPPAFCAVPWIEVEAKQKEVAIAKLQAEWLPVCQQSVLLSHA